YDLGTRLSALSATADDPRQNTECYNRFLPSHTFSVLRNISAFARSVEGEDHQRITRRRSDRISHFRICTTLSESRAYGHRVGSPLPRYRIRRPAYQGGAVSAGY